MSGCASVLHISAAVRQTGTFDAVDHDVDGATVVRFHAKSETGAAVASEVRTKLVIGADGARSNVAKQCVKGAENIPYVFAYHEIVRAPAVRDRGYAGPHVRAFTLRHFLPGQAVA